MKLTNRNDFAKTTKKTFTLTIIGLMLAAMIIPAALAADTGWQIPTAYTTTGWATPGNVYVDDTAYATTTSQNTRTVWYDFAFPSDIPTGATITGIEVKLLAARSTGTQGYLAVSLTLQESALTNVNSGDRFTDEKNTSPNLNNVIDVPTVASDEYTVGAVDDPWQKTTSGTTEDLNWDPADINAYWFGVKVESRGGGASGAIWQIDLIQMRITYEEEVTNHAPYGLSLTGDEIDENGVATVSGSFSDDGVGDTFTLTIDWGEGSPVTYDLGSSKSFSKTHQYLDDNPTSTDSDDYTVSVTVEDSLEDTASETTIVTVNNVAPTLSEVTGSTINENAYATVSGTITDPGTLDTFTVTIDWGEGSPVDYSYVAGSTSFSETHQYLDDNPTGTSSDNYDISVSVTDDDTGSDSGTTTVTVNNVAPVIATPLSPLIADPHPLGYSITLTASFTDVGTLDTHTATFHLSNGTDKVGSIVAGTASSGPLVFTSAGLYEVTVTIADDDLGSDTEKYDGYIVIYDPSAGFVTGGGWINSPAGAYVADPLLTGKATFGFVSQYKKGANVPTGNTEFQFHAAGMNFKSKSYEWLVVAGSKAIFKGVGTINGEGSYGFMLTASDKKTGDLFRIKIWNIGTGDIVYDNQMDASDTDDPTTAIAGGSIVVH